MIEFASKSAVPYMAAEEFLSICKKKKRELCVCVRVLFSGFCKCK